MIKQNYSQRRENLRALLKKNNLGAILVSLDANRYYLSGFELHDQQTNESNGYLIVMADGNDWLCSDHRYEEAMLRMWDPNHIFIYTSVGTAASQINDFLKKNLKGTLGFEAAALNVAFFEGVSEGLQAQKADGLIESLRMIKDENELKAIESAMELSHQMMAWVPSVLTPGRTELEISWDIEQFYRNRGATELSFANIVAINTNAALCHAIPGDDKITDNCSILIDSGCKRNDYNSDQTRVFWVGNKPSDVYLRTLEQVQKAQSLAIEAIRPGIACKDIYYKAWNYFDSLGVAKYFNHGLGHSIGLQTHESPNFNSKCETILKPGMVITVEPGLYYAEWGGVRWEYVIVVTEDGVRVLK